MWAKIDDGFPEHPKIVGLSDQAFRMHVSAICYSSRHLTDGFVPQAAAYGWVRHSATAVIGGLIRAGLWSEVEGGFTIHDYLFYNPSRAEVESKRKAKAMAGAKGAASRWQDRGNAPVPVPVPVPIDQRTPPPAPPPPPKPAREAAAGDDAYRKAYRAFEAMGGRLVGSTVQRKIDDAVEDSEMGADWVVAACEEAAMNDVRTWAYAQSILDRWKRDGFKADKRERTGATNGRAAAATTEQSLTADQVIERTPGLTPLNKLAGWDENRRLRASVQAAQSADDESEMAARRREALDEVRPGADKAGDISA